MSAVVYLIRHGIAGPPPPGMGDSDRTLTPAGARKVAQVARGLERLGIVPDAVLTSPLPRAHETAKKIVEVLAPALQIRIHPKLAPGHQPREILKTLRVTRRVRHVFLIGHEPDLGRLASHLFTGAAGSAPFRFKKAAVAAFEVDAIPPRSACPLLWFLTAKQLRSIRGTRSS